MSRVPGEKNSLEGNSHEAENTDDTYYRDDADYRGDADYRHGIFARVSPLIDLHSSLALDTGCAAHGGAYVSHGVSLEVVPLPGLLPEE